MKTAGLGECSQLCDVYQMERVCELVSGAFHMARNGSPSSLPESLKSLLIAPLRRYLFTLTARGSRRARSAVRMEVAPTLTLIAAAEAVISGVRVGPWGEGEAEAAAVSLRFSWAIWISYVASYWLTVEVPKRLADHQVQRAHGAIGGATPKKGPDRSTDKAFEIVETYKELQSRMEPSQVAGAVANKLKLTPQWIRKVWNKHEVKKAKQQASL